MTYLRISKIALMIDHVTDNHACWLCGGESSKNPQPGSRVHHHGGTSDYCLQHIYHIFIIIEVDLIIFDNICITFSS